MASVPISRVGDHGSHGGIIKTGSLTFKDENKSVARVGDIYACPRHGDNPIITGVDNIFDRDHKVAVVGSLTACGARIISGSAGTTVDIPALTGSHGCLESILTTLFGPLEEEAIPGLGLSQEVICAKLSEVRASKIIQKKIHEIASCPKKINGNIRVG